MSQGNRHPIGEMNGGWAFLLKLALALVVPGICSQIWLSRTVWVLDERVTNLMEHIHDVKADLADVTERIELLERKP